MSDETEYEAPMSRDDVADYLEEFAQALRGTGSVSFDVGDETVTTDVPDTVEFEIEYEEESEVVGSDERSIEFELEWDVGE